MPESFEPMRLLCFRDVTDQPERSLHMKYDPPMEHWIREAAVSVMMALEKIESFTADPLLHSHVRYGAPCKWSFWDCLIEAVNPQGVVSSGPPKQGALVSVGDVTTGAGINQAPVTIEREPDTQGIGVAVAGITRALWAGINHHLLRDRLFVRDQIDTSRLEGPRTPGDSARLAAEYRERALAEQPDGFFGQTGRRAPVRTLVLDRSNYQGVGHMFDAIPSRIEDSAAIIISETLDSAGFR